MNWPPPTSRLFIGTLHQVQDRSGRSAAGAACGDDADDGESDMAGILANDLKICQRKFGRNSRHQGSSALYCKLCTHMPFTSHRKVTTLYAIHQRPGIH